MIYKSLQQTLFIIFLGMLSQLLWAESKNAPATVLVSIKPLALIFAALCPHHSDSVEVLLPTDKDLHEYALTISDLQKLEKAQTVFWMGASTEVFMVKFLSRLPASQHRVALAESGAHAWLDSQQLVGITNKMAQELGEIYPQEKAAINTNAKKFLADIHTQQSDWQKKLKVFQNKPFLLGHDAFKAFAQNLGLKQGLLYLSSNDHGHAQAGIYELLDLQKRIANREIVCALQEPEVDFGQLAKRYPQLQLATLDIMASNIAINPKGYLAFFDENAKAFQHCLL